MNTFKYTLLFILALSIFGLSSCKKKSPLTEKEQRLLDLQNGGKGWVLGSTGSVIKDGYDVTSQFTGFKLILGKYTYSTQNSLSSVWETTGTWQFQNNNPDIIVRGDGLVMDVLFATTILDLVFIGPGSTGGRIDGVSGEYQFHLISE